MAKCVVCNQSKGKRECIRENSMICSRCCGTTRTAESCGDCRYYRPPAASRNYRALPRFTPAEMQHNLDLGDFSNTVEGALCAFDMQQPTPLRDAVALSLLQLLLDKYCFQDAEPGDLDPVLAVGLEQITDAIDQAIGEEQHSEDFRKVLACVWYVAQRRSKGNREYLDVIARYVGPSVAPGIRILPQRD